MSLAVGHATRTIDENLKAATEDITIQTSLLEIRYIAGDKALASKMKSSWSKWLSQQSPLWGYLAKKSHSEIASAQWA